MGHALDASSNTQTEYRKEDRSAFIAENLHLHLISRATKKKDLEQSLYNDEKEGDRKGLNRTM
jgi:hypothetical protein